MRRISAKRREELEEIRPGREMYREACDGRCEVCGRVGVPEIHEIPAGSHRHRAERSPNCFLGVCRDCHEEWQGAAYVSQFWKKCRAVLRAINRCVGRNVLDEEELLGPPEDDDG